MSGDESSDGLAGPEGKGNFPNNNNHNSHSFPCFPLLWCRLSRDQEEAPGVAGFGGGGAVFKENPERDVSDLISISISISGLQEAPPPTRAWSRSRFHSLPDRFYICVGRDRIDLSDRDSNHFQIPEG